MGVKVDEPMGAGTHIIQARTGLSRTNTAYSTRSPFITIVIIYTKYKL